MTEVAAAPGARPRSLPRAGWESRTFHSPRTDAPRRLQQGAAKPDAELPVLGQIGPPDRARVPAPVEALQRGNQRPRGSRGSPPTAGSGAAGRPAPPRAGTGQLGADLGSQVLDVLDLHQHRPVRRGDPHATGSSRCWMRATISCSSRPCRSLQRLAEVVVHRCSASPWSPASAIVSARAPRAQAARAAPTKAGSGVPTQKQKHAGNPCAARRPSDPGRSRPGGPHLAASTTFSSSPAGRAPPPAPPHLLVRRAAPPGHPRRAPGPGPAAAWSPAGSPPSRSERDDPLGGGGRRHTRRPYGHPRLAAVAGEGQLGQHHRAGGQRDHSGAASASGAKAKPPTNTGTRARPGGRGPPPDRRHGTRARARTRRELEKRPPPSPPGWPPIPVPPARSRHARAARSRRRGRRAGEPASTAAQGSSAAGTRTGDRATAGARLPRLERRSTRSASSSPATALSSQRAPGPDPVNDMTRCSGPREARPAASRPSPRETAISPVRTISIRPKGRTISLQGGDLVVVPLPRW